MKRLKVVSVVMTFVIITQLLPLVSSANDFRDNIVESNETQIDEIYKENGLSAEVTDDELLEAYKIFNQFTEENDLSVIFDYESFKEEYFTLGYNGIDEYLKALYGVFDLTQNDNDSLGVNDGSINSARVGNYRNGLDYSDEVLQAYEDVSAVFESENVLLDLCLEDFSRNYEMSDKDIFEYSEEVIENLSEMQKTSYLKEQTYYRASGSNSSGDKKYYYDIGASLNVTPNYSKYNIIQLA